MLYLICGDSPRTQAHKRMIWRFAETVPPDTEVAILYDGPDGNSDVGSVVATARGILRKDVRLLLAVGGIVPARDLATWKPALDIIIAFLDMHPSPGTYRVHDARLTAAMLANADALAIPTIRFSYDDGIPPCTWTSPSV